MTPPAAPLTGRRRRRGSGRDVKPVIGGAFIVFAVVLGGATGAGLLANAALQLIAVLVIGWMMLGRSRQVTPEVQRRLVMMLCLFALLHLAQLIPLPPAIWTRLSGRQHVVEGLNALGIAPGWMPLSLDPALTLSSALSLLPPAAAIVLACTSRGNSLRMPVITVVLVSGLTMLLGAAQFARGGPYIYDSTNIGSAVGFFANANHYGTLLCVIIPLTAGLVSRTPGSTGRIPRAFRLTILAGTIVLALAGIVLTRSTAAMALSLLSIASSLVIVFPKIRGWRRFGLMVGAVVATSLCLFILMWSSPDNLMPTGFDADAMSRPGIWRVTIAAIREFGIGGAGFGVFEQAFHLFEDPNLVGSIYANHAHNDLLELILVGGLPAVLLLLFFLQWFARQAAAVWLAGGDADPLAQAASAAATIILLHSLVDYPLRTAAIAVIFGSCLAIMSRETKRESELRSGIGKSDRHLVA